MDWTVQAAGLLARADSDAEWVISEGSAGEFSPVPTDALHLTESIPSLISPHLISEVPLANLLWTVPHSTPASKGQSISALAMGSSVDL